MSSSRVIALIVIVAQHGLTGCAFDCQENGCTGGFRWSGHPEDGASVAAGRYEFTIEVEDIVHIAECTISGAAGDSSCEPVVPVEDTSPFTVGLYLVDAGDDDDPANLEFSLHAFEPEGRSVRGPGAVSVAIELDDRPLFAQTYELDYERDEGHFGDERCGFCDVVQQRDATWPR